MCSIIRQSIDMIHKTRSARQTHRRHERRMRETGDSVSILMDCPSTVIYLRALWINAAGIGGFELKARRKSPTVSRQLTATYIGGAVTIHARGVTYVDTDGYSSLSASLGVTRERCRINGYLAPRYTILDEAEDQGRSLPSKCLSRDQKC